MARYILLLVVLSFALTASASAAMMCCWNMGQGRGAPEMPCHGPDENSDTTSLNCCDEMALCKVPLVYSSADAALDFMTADSPLRSFSYEWALINVTGPPTPPPKLFL